MDINGYQLLLQTARMNTYAGEEPPLKLYEIHDISWGELRKVFKNYKSWAALNDEESDLMKFLKETCLYEDSPESGDDMRFDSFKLRVLGLLWCEGGADEKSVEFYDNCQDNNQPEIAAEDKDFAPNFYQMLNFATEVVFKYELIYGPGSGGTPAFSDDQIAETKDEKYETLLNEFLDSVFGYESKIRREDWQAHVAAQCDWVFHPDQIREKLEYNL